MKSSNKSSTFFLRGIEPMQKKKPPNPLSKSRTNWCEDKLQGFKKVLDKKSLSVVLFDIDYTLFDTAFFKESGLSQHKIYEEVMQVLDSLNEIAILGIFSKGEVAFQKTKLEKTGMRKFFEENNIHIFDDKDANLISVLEKYKDSKLFLVDDKLGVLCSAKKYMPQVIAIWVKRGPFAQNQKEIAGFTPDAEIKNLSEVVKIIRS